MLTWIRILTSCMTVYRRAKFEKPIGSAVENRGLRLREFLRIFSQFEAKNDPKRGFGARASKNNTQMAERGRVFSASYKKEEMQPKDWLLLRLRPADFLFSRLPGSRAAELLSGMANIQEKTVGQQA
jgi:hypothetical protein